MELKEILIVVIFTVLISFAVYFTAGNISGFVVKETTYKNSVWTCPDGIKYQESSCKSYASLIDQSKTFCKTHCSYKTKNIKQCNPSFVLGEKCIDETESTSSNLESSDSSNPISDLTDSVTESLQTVQQAYSTKTDILNMINSGKVRYPSTMSQTCNDVCNSKSEVCIFTHQVIKNKNTGMVENVFVRSCSSSMGTEYECFCVSPYS